LKIGNTISEKPQIIINIVIISVYKIYR